jgi:tRNA A-37 threonylcarbamoyl transferase component Bud32
VNCPARAGHEVGAAVGHLAGRGSGGLFAQEKARERGRARPLPAQEKKSRRPGARSVCMAHPSVHVQKLVAVKEHPGQRSQALCGHEAAGKRRLIGAWRPSVGQGIGTANLRVALLSDIVPDSPGELLRHPQDEGVIEHRQRLQRRGGDRPTRSRCRGVWAVERIEEAIARETSCDAAYEIYDVRGRGGMGIVLDAFDTVLHRRVAIKVLSPQLATSQTAHRRFLREARAAAGINHVNVVTVHAVDEQAGMPYLVMEYVAGRTLRERIRLGPLDLVTMPRIGAQIAAGLAAAHEHGVIHRDIKPANVLLADGVERVKISDFSLALVLLDNTQASSAERPVGTPAYMSPEKVGGQRVDACSDLFNLGCVLYAMSTGKSDKGVYEQSGLSAISHAHSRIFRQ